MGNSERVWLSRESFETLSQALQNIQVRQDPSIFTPRFTFSGAGKTASIFLDLPSTPHGDGGEYMSYFKIVDRTDTIQQAPNSGYDVYKYKIAVCDGGTYDEERGTSSASRFYLNEGYVDGYRFPYRESQVFKASSSPLYVQVKMVIQLDIGEKEEGSGDDGEEEIFVPEYSVLVDREREQEVNTYDYKTGKLTCVFTIGRVSFPEYSRKEVSQLKIIQDHLTGPLRLFWYISCGDVQNDEEEEE